jgi:hypothetical protein
LPGSQTLSEVLFSKRFLDTENHERREGVNKHKTMNANARMFETELLAREEERDMAAVEVRTTTEVRSVRAV